MLALIITVTALVAFLLMFLHSEPFFPALALVGAGAAGGTVGGAILFQRFLPGAKWSKGPRPANVVSFYKETDFKEPRRDFPVGSIQASLSKGFGRTGLNKENDTYSSLQVPPGMVVQAYVDNDFRGMSKVYPAGDYPNLADFNDKISSFKVLPAGTSTNTPVAIFHTDKDFKGKQFIAYGVGQHPSLNFTPTATSNLDNRDNMISSVHIEPGYKVRVYTEPNFGGAEGIWTAGGIKYVGDYWNDKISSIKIEKA